MLGALQLLLIIASLICTQGQKLGFVRECDELTPVQILNDATIVKEKAGQTMNKFTELIEQDEELQRLLNSTGFIGVILIPENAAIFQSTLSTDPQELLQQFKLNVVVGQSDEVARTSLQGSKIIMSSSIVANEEGGASAEVIDIQQFGQNCNSENVSQFEVWIISDFLPIPQSGDDQIPAQQVAPTPATNPLQIPMFQTPSTEEDSTTFRFSFAPQKIGNSSSAGSVQVQPGQTDNGFLSSMFAASPRVEQEDAESPSLSFFPTAQSSQGFDPTKLEEELRAPFIQYQQVPIELPPPLEDNSTKCVKGSPLELFQLSGQVRRLASEGAKFLEEVALQAQQSGDSKMFDYLNDVNYEGIILLPSDSAIQNYRISPNLNGEFSDLEIAQMHIIPKDINQQTIGPIQNSIQGSSVKLIRDDYVENEDQRRVYLEAIDEVGLDCDQFEFWILRSQPLLPPPRVAPSPPEIDIFSLLPGNTASPPPLPLSVSQSPPPSALPPPEPQQQIRSIFDRIVPSNSQQAPTNETTDGGIFLKREGAGRKSLSMWDMQIGPSSEDEDIDVQFLLNDSQYESQGSTVYVQPSEESELSEIDFNAMLMSIDFDAEMETVQEPENEGMDELS
eukprot:TRINITY_DN315_c1_g1_i1.p1 TRINITY_DN315_c1_g1~~TRINITY_DN315_c1_g1_i1.p1  ORF type:complete len:619 (-),score=83.65 TRINITY_DN315_c1_g1_i1:265-2121(-)